MSADPSDNPFGRPLVEPIELGRGELLAHVPTEAIAILGEDHVLAMEKLKLEVDACVAVSTYELPRTHRELWEFRFPEEVATAKYEIERVTRLPLRLAKPGDVVETVRTVTPVIASAVANATDRLGDDAAALYMLPAGARQHVKTLAEMKDEDLASNVPTISSLEATFTGLMTRELPSRDAIKKVASLVRAEKVAYNLDLFFSGLLRAPDALERHAADLGAGEEFFDQTYLHILGTELFAALTVVGLQDPELGTVHRPIDKQAADGKFIEQFAADCEMLLPRANDVVSGLNTLGQRASRAVLAQLIDLMHAAHAKNNGLQENDVATLRTEEYIAALANFTNVAMNRVRLELSDRWRAELRTLASKPLNLALRQAEKGRKKLAPKAPGGAEIDPKFRHATKEAKDILKGGGRLNYPNASRIAKELHAMVFDGKARVRFEAAESGIVIAILMDKLDALIDTLAHFAGNDPQAEALRREQLETYQQLRSFNFEASFSRVAQVFGHPTYRNKLDKVLSPAEVRKVSTFFDELRKLAQAQQR